MNRTIVTLLILALAACDTGPSAESGAAGEPATREQPANGGQTAGGEALGDGRTAIALPAPARQSVLAEMRMMMGALQGMLAAMGTRDADAFAEAATGGGVAVAVDRDAAMGNRLPEEFASLGMSTHAAFDELAARASAGASFDTLAAGMGAVIEKCNLCHESYRLETAP